MPPIASAAAEKSGHRISVSLTAEQYEQLAEIARENRISIAWVVREAIERLLEDDRPLFQVKSHSS